MLSSNNILKPADGRPVTMPTQDMIIGLYHLTLRGQGRPGRRARLHSVAEAIMAFDARPARPAGGRQDPDGRLRPVGRRSARGLEGDSRARSSSSSRRRSAAPCSTRRCRQLPVRRRGRRQEGALGDRQRPGRAGPEGRRGRDARRAQGVRFPLGHALRASRSRSRTSSRRRTSRRSSRRYERSREGAGPVRPRSDHRRRASPGAHRDLEPGHQRGRQGDGGELPPTNSIFRMVSSGCPW